MRIETQSFGDQQDKKKKRVKGVRSCNVDWRDLHIADIVQILSVPDILASR